MSSADQTRPVCIWLADLDVQRIESLVRFFYADDPASAFMQSLADRAKAAPENAAEAVRAACFAELKGYVSPNHSQEVASAVLRALVQPEARARTALGPAVRDTPPESAEA